VAVVRVDFVVETTTFQLFPPLVEAEIWYAVTREAPLAGAAQCRCAAPPETTADTLRGTPGALIGETVADGVEAAATPAFVIARTRNW
jgi:hypothetical protein